MKARKIKVLLVEDDENLGFVTSDTLSDHGFNIDWQKDGKAGFDAFCKNEYDLCILDVMLPIKDGFTLAREIKAMNPQIPILFLTAKSLDYDKIEGFKIGADDYVTKPFNIDLLSLRMKALYKRSLPFSPAQEDLLHVGNITFDYNSQLITTGTHQEKLSKKETEIFKLLCIYKNKVLSREIALKMIWGENDYFKGRSMDVFIARLRKVLKIDDSLEIITVHGKGFQLTEKE
ncbi:MAG: two-component system OmpR family response regulator [Saprospiraceae bacterium]|jgi:two-component system OmpR family response regulator